jgi:HAD superfamily hydrolase (TIGR01509 family)
MFLGVILDVDGTLVDSNDAHAHAWADALREFLRDVPFERVRPLIGMGGDKLLPLVTGLSEEHPEGKAIAERRARIFREQYLPSVKPFAGARELVLRLEQAGYRLAVASSSRPEELGALLRAAGVETLIEEKTSAGEVEESKPEPDVVAAALNKLALPAREAVLIGDTPYDVEAGRRAGVPVIAFRCGGWSDVDLHGTLAVYEGPADLLARFDSSPLRRAA